MQTVLEAERRRVQETAAAERRWQRRPDPQRSEQLMKQIRLVEVFALSHPQPFLKPWHTWMPGGARGGAAASIG